jgi:hypothetical protein
MFTGDISFRRSTYAGQCKDGYACGLGVTTLFEGHKYYAEHGPDGKYDGRCLFRNAAVHRDAYRATIYRLFERGEWKAEARVYGNFRHCVYNFEVCSPKDPRLLALIAQVAPVEVRPAASAPHPPLARPLAPPSNRPMDRPARFPPAGARRRRGHRGAHPRRTPSLLAARQSPTAAALPRTTSQCSVHGRTFSL